MQRFTPYLLILLVSGCSVGPHYVATEPNVPAAFASQPASPTVSEIDAEWWKKFHDETLNSLLSQAESENRDLKIAQARLREARALWTAARFDLVPTVTSSAGYSNLKTTGSRSSVDTGRNYDLHEVALDATWELDLFGRVRHSIKAARATEEAVAAERDALLIALRAEVAVNYLLLRGAQALLEVARSNADNQAESLRIAEASLEGGRGTQLDVARARAQWNATRASIPQFQIDIDKSIHRVAVLCGTAPSTLRASLVTPRPLPGAPNTVVLSCPSEVLRRRPDIRVAERTLASATERVGVATADLFPRVTFNGSFGLEAGSFKNLGRTSSTVYQFGPSLTWPAFDLARVKQLLKADGARADAALSNYEQTVLLALEEAENALTEFDRETARLHFLRASASSAEEAARLARQRYRDGVSDFLDVLDSERVALSAQSEAVASGVRRSVAWVTVYKAMGGGWTMTPEKPGTSSKKKAE
ncbi:MAG: efflux transporter outer membrane subunit [Verrucomicrobiales bacterium]|jgi:multidrug efflux system outer membrane protein|nr:efflux transporter outer membrane subunit [Verrucomicrobiales bacterium]